MEEKQYVCERLKFMPKSSQPGTNLNQALKILTLKMQRDKNAINQLECANPKREVVMGRL
jgi:hypothetical protein